MAYKRKVTYRARRRQARPLSSAPKRVAFAPLKPRNRHYRTGYEAVPRTRYPALQLPVQLHRVATDVISPRSSSEAATDPLLATGHILNSHYSATMPTFLSGFRLSIDLINYSFADTVFEIYLFEAYSPIVPPLKSDGQQHLAEHFPLGDGAGGLGPPFQQITTAFRAVLSPRLGRAAFKRRFTVPGVIQSKGARITSYSKYVPVNRWVGRDRHDDRPADFTQYYILVVGKHPRDTEGNRQARVSVMTFFRTDNSV